MTIASDITVADADIIQLCKKYQVRELSVFGSVARGDHRPDSDVDLLVDFDPRARHGLLELAGLIEDFSDLVGRRVDVAVKPALKPLVQAEIMADVRILYAA